MNREKLLIQMVDVPNFISVSEMVYEMTRIMRFSYIEAREIAGMFLEEGNMGREKNKFFLLLVKLSQIKRLKELCIKIDGTNYLYVLNSRIEIKFPGLKKYSAMTANVANGQTSDKEIMIRNTPFLSLEDILNKLPEYFKKSINKTHRILSISQNRASTFLKFTNADYAQRARRIFQRDSLIVESSTTYICFCLEDNEQSLHPRINFPVESVSQASIQYRLQRISQEHISNVGNDINPSANNIQRRPALNRSSRTTPYPLTPVSSAMQTNDRQDQAKNININEKSKISYRITDMGVVRTFNDMLTALAAQGIQLKMVQSQASNKVSPQQDDPNVLVLSEPVDFSDVN
ncbi:hypothetical protein ACKWTF_010380 [Chironomus riparius]